jgi:hypothetical protein
MAAAPVLVFAGGASAATTRLVDDNKAECPNAAFTSIQSAVNAAAAGDTVAVCPGTYREAVGLGDLNALRIDRSLTLRGAGADLVRIEPSADLVDPTPAIRDEEGNVILVDPPSGAVDISGVTVAAGDASHPRTADAGVVFHNASGSISRSRLTDLAPADLADYSTGVGQGVVAFSDGTPPAGFTLGMSSTLVDGHAKGGVLVDAPPAAPLTATITDSTIRGRGPRSAPGQGQNGIQVSGQGARATIERNTIVDHRFLGDESASAAVLMFDADVAGSAIRDNDFRGNGYGVFNADGSGCDNATPVAAGSNWWGSPLGPTVDLSSGPPATCGPFAPTGDPALGDRVNGAAVNFAGFRTAPRGASPAPGRQADGAPSVAITSPADGTTAAPGSPVPVDVAATDDFDVKRVEFRRGGTLVDTDTMPPYSASVSAPAAGSSQAVTATAFDSADQTSVAAISLRGAAPETPQAPAEPEDRPPTVAITSPGPGAQVSPAAPPRVTADAADDRGVARVVFLDDGQQVCSDDTAPYDCAYAPNGGDVGRNTLIAIAVDGAGQTAVDFRSLSVGRFDPKLTARTTPKRDRRRPYRYTTTGSVLLPAGVTPEQACSGGGSVALEFRVGKLRLPMTAAVRPDCSFRTSIAFPSRRSLGNGRIAVSAKFGGNAVLGTAKAPSQKVRAG